MDTPRLEPTELTLYAGERVTGYLDLRRHDQQWVLSWKPFMTEQPVIEAHPVPSLEAGVRILLALDAGLADTAPPDLAAVVAERDRYRAALEEIRKVARDDIAKPCWQRVDVDIPDLIERALEEQ